MRSYLTLARLRFLVYSPVIYTIGAVTARAFHVGLYLLGIVVVYLTHIATHFYNEYFDYEFDVRNTTASKWTGGSRVLVEGLLKRVDALVAALVMSGLAAVLLVFMPLRAAIVGVVALFFAWAYSGPPLALERRGLGELTVVLVVVVLAPIFGAELQGDVREPLLYILIPLAIIQFLRMLVMNMADLDADREAGKRTLVVRSARARAIAPRLSPATASRYNGLAMVLALICLFAVYPPTGARLVMLYPLVIVVLTLLSPRPT